MRTKWWDIEIPRTWGNDLTAQWLLVSQEKDSVLWSQTQHLNWQTYLLEDYRSKVKWFSWSYDSGFSYFCKAEIILVWIFDLAATVKLDTSVETWFRLPTATYILSHIRHCRKPRIPSSKVIDLQFWTHAGFQILFQILVNSRNGGSQIFQPSIWNNIFFWFSCIWKTAIHSQTDSC